MIGAKHVKDDSGCFETCFDLHERALRGRWLLRWRWALAFLFLGLALACTPAYAASGQVIINDATVFVPNSNEVKTGYLVAAYNYLDAAALICGVEPSTIGQVERGKLSSEGSGGEFYELAQDVKEVEAATVPYWADSAYNAFTILWKTGAEDENLNLYTCEVSKEFLASAKDDLQTVLSGGDLGGGGSVISSDFFYYECPTIFTTNYNQTWTQKVGEVNYTNVLQLISGGNYVSLPDTIYIKIPKVCFSSYSDYEQSINKKYTYIILDSVNRNSNSCLNITNILFTDVEPSLTYSSFNASYNDITKTGDYIRDIRTSENVIVAFGSNNVTHPLWQDSYTFDGRLFTVKDTVRFTNRRLTTAGSNGYPAGIGVSSIDTPTNNWPDDPVEKQPPEVPTPPEPTQPVQPVQPSPPTSPTLPPIIGYTEPTYQTPDLSAILDAMNEHCVHIQNSIYTNISDLWDALAQKLTDEGNATRLELHNQIGWLASSIDSDFQNLSNYLRQLFEWLASQMNFTFTAPEYDDTSVISWLKRIYGKLGTGSVTTRPTDPVIDPPGAWDWLWTLINGILASLGEGAGRLAGTLGDLLEGVKEKFPFSVPWDIAAILALFAGPAQTPKFTIAYTVFDTPIRYDIDLSPYDDAMAGVRSVEDVIFCFYLLFKTQWLSNEFDNLGRFLGGKVRTSMRS